MEVGVISVCRGREKLSQTELYDELLGQVDFAEQAGLAAFWIAEHHFSTWGTVRNTLMMLAAASQRTSRIRLGSGVVVLPLHHPVRVAEEAAMVDHLSHGRLDLGIGRGARPHELAGYGLDYDHRMTLFQEALAVLRLAWEGRPVTFQGERFTFDELPVLPAPIQRPHPPIWHAVSDPASLEDAGSHGDNLLISSRDIGDSSVVEAVGTFRRAAVAAGHPNVKVGYSSILYLGSNDTEVRDVGLPFLRRHYGEGGDPNDPLRPTAKAIARFEKMTEDEVAANYAVETPDRLIARLSRLNKATGNGIDLFIAAPQFGDQETANVQHTMQLLAAEVVPALRSLPVG